MCNKTDIKSCKGCDGGLHMECCELETWSTEDWCTGKTVGEHCWFENEEWKIN